MGHLYFLAPVALYPKIGVPEQYTTCSGTLDESKGKQVASAIFYIAISSCAICENCSLYN